MAPGGYGVEPMITISLFLHLERTDRRRDAAETPVADERDARVAAIAVAVTVAASSAKQGREHVRLARRMSRRKSDTIPRECGAVCGRREGARWGAEQGRPTHRRIAETITELRERVTNEARGGVIDRQAGLPPNDRSDLAEGIRIGAQRRRGVTRRATPGA